MKSMFELAVILSSLRQRTWCNFSKDLFWFIVSDISAQVLACSVAFGLV